MQVDRKLNLSKIKRWVCLHAAGTFKHGRTLLRISDSGNALAFPTRGSVELSEEQLWSRPIDNVTPHPLIWFRIFLRIRVYLRKVYRDDLLNTEISWHGVWDNMHDYRISRPISVDLDGAWGNVQRIPLTWLYGFITCVSQLQLPYH